MANTKDTQTKTAIEPPAETVRQTDTAPTIAETSSKHTYQPDGYKIFLSLIALLALGLSLYACFQIWQSNISHQKQETIFSVKLETLQQQQSDMNKQFSAATKSMADTQLQSQKEMTLLKKSLQSALDEHHYQTQDWLLLKARHYLELAQINAQWSEDPNTSIGLFQQADATLKEINIQKIFPVRQMIATELSQLQTLPPVDISGILGQLDALQTVVAKQPIVADTLPLNTDPAQNQQEPVSTWQSHLQKSMRFLEKLVVIKHYDEDSKPDLSPMHQTLLRESIRINLQEAQWAVLQNNTKLYQQFLDQALKNTERAFGKNTQITQKLIKQIQTLQQKTLRTEKPVVDQSLQLLNQLIDSNSKLRALPASHAGDKSS